MKRTTSAVMTKKVQPPLKKHKPTLARPVTKRSTSGNVEKKNIDVQSAASTVVAGQVTATVVPLVIGCIEGTAPTQHVGRRVQLKSLQVRWQGSMSSTSINSSPLRIVVIYDKQANAAQCTAAQVFAQDQISSPMNLSNSKRFIILLDKEIECVGTQGPQSWSINEFRKIDLPIEFNETNGGTVADITTGSVTAFFYQIGQIATASPLSSFYSRLRFTDQ